MGRIFFEAASLKLTVGIELAQSFPIATKTFTQHLIIVHGNVAQMVDFIHHLLLLKKILVNMMLKHLLGPKRNLHVMYWLDKFQENIALGHVGADASVLSILIVGSSNNLLNFPYWWS